MTAHNHNFQPRNPHHARYRRFTFGRTDRITIDAVHYVPHGKKSRGVHYFNPVRDGVISTVVKAFTDEEIAVALKGKRLDVDQAYFSKAGTQLRQAYQDFDIGDLREDQARSVWWKSLWVECLLDAHGDRHAEFRPSLTRPDVAQWIEQNRDRIHKRYRETYVENRRPGPAIPTTGEEPERKDFDWPAASTLLGWLSKFESADYSVAGLLPNTSACGNRQQIDAEVETLIKRRINAYCTPERLTMKKIIGFIEHDLAMANRNRPADEKLYISPSAIRARIRKLRPYIVELGRYGRNAARARFAGVGKGIAHEAFAPLDRIEADDWESDLYTLFAKSSALKGLSKKKKLLLSSVRINVSAAVDCCTSSVVGLSVSIDGPSVATSRATIRSVLTDKTPLAEWVGAGSDWPMYGPWRNFVTDGGPANLGVVRDTVATLGLPRTIPEKDPRKRGHIESFFATLRIVMQNFAGRAFSNVVERGDYPATELASVAFAEFHKSLILWIVDSYHHSPKSTLNGLTPYAPWEKFASRGPGFAMGPSDRQMAIAFGFSRRRSLDRYGLRFANLDYNNRELARLNRLNLQKKITFHIDPEDIGTIHVLIPRANRVDFGDRHYLQVPAIDRSVHGHSLIDRMLADKYYREAALLAREKGIVVRLAAEERLYEDGLEYRRRAGIPTAFLTETEIALFEKHCEQIERAAFEDVDHAADPVTVDGDSFGEKIADGVLHAPKDTRQIADAGPQPDDDDGSFSFGRDDRVDTEIRNTPDTTRPDVPDRPASSAMNHYDGDDE